MLAESRMRGNSKRTLTPLTVQRVSMTLLCLDRLDLRIGILVVRLQWV